jgi:AcrR family transcriptional regulator
MQTSGAKPVAPATLTKTSSAEHLPAGAPAFRRGRGRLRAEDVRELEAQLIAAARDTFIAQGYGATSMAALARSACVSKTTLYAKFPTKAALFRAIIDEQLAQAYGAVRETAGPAAETLAGSLRHLAEQTVTAALEPANLNLNRLIDWEAPRFPELAEVVQARARIGIAHIAGYIRKFAAQDRIPCRDPEGAAEIFNFAVRGLYDELRVTGRRLSPDELRAKIERIVAVFLASRPDW